MLEASAAFVGSVPENYERLFEPYADNLVARLPKQNDISVLETACDTGIVTQRLAAGFARRRDANRDRS